MSSDERPFLSYQPIQQIVKQGFVPSGSSGHNWVKKTKPYDNKEVHVNVEHWSMTGFMVRFSTLNKGTSPDQQDKWDHSSVCLSGIDPYSRSDTLERILNSKV